MGKGGGTSPYEDAAVNAFTTTRMIWWLPSEIVQAPKQASCENEKPDGSLFNYTMLVGQVGSMVFVRD